MPTLAQPVKWGQDNPLEAAPELTEEELDSLRKRMLAMDKLLETHKKAKYKIELFFGHARSMHSPFPGALSLWESGTKLHGGGDDKVYECPAEASGRPPCNGVIGGSFQGYAHLVCPECKHVWRSEQVFGERLARLTNQGWATLTLRYFIRLGHNADIYMKYPKQDIRVAAGLEQAKQMMGDKLVVARAMREKAVYPLKNIITDTSNGSDILARMRAFIDS